MILSRIFININLLTFFKLRYDCKATRVLKNQKARKVNIRSIISKVNSKRMLNQKLLLKPKILMLQFCAIALILVIEETCRELWEDNFRWILVWCWKNWLVEKNLHLQIVDRSGYLKRNQRTFLLVACFVSKHLASKVKWLLFNFVWNVAAEWLILLTWMERWVIWKRVLVDVFCFPPLGLSWSQEVVCVKFHSTSYCLMPWTIRNNSPIR